MVGEKRRLYLCDRPYVFPQYDLLTADKNINDTLNSWNEPTDKVYIPSNTWPKNMYPDDTVS